MLMLLGLGIGCKATVDTDNFEELLRGRTQELGLAGAKVHCPANVEASAGKKFTCDVAVGGASYALDVTVTSVDLKSRKANFDTAWHDGPAVAPAKLAAALTTELTKQLGGAVTIACGDEPLRFLDAKRHLGCKLAAGAVATSVDIEFDKDLNATAWHLDPPLLARAKLEAILAPAVREKTAPDVQIRCGTDEFVVRPADGVVWCAVTDGKHDGKLKVEIDDKLNVTRWEIPPA